MLVIDIIKINNLTRDYGHGRGIFNISFNVMQGEVFGFLGPNGAGKTTTIRHLMGFLQPKTGQCIINGYDCWKQRPEIQKILGYIPGEMTFPDDLTGNEFLDFYAKYRGMEDDILRYELIEMFNLDPYGKMKKMSKGMKQKVGIIAAFMHDPEILILDEPTSGLDPLMQNRFIELIQSEKKRGKTILMSSHIFEEVERTCQRVGIIRNGRMVAVDSVDALKGAQVKKYIITFAEEADTMRFINEDLDTEKIDTTNVTVFVHNNINKMISILSNYSVTNITTPNQSLEEVFMNYYGGDNS